MQSVRYVLALLLCVVSLIGMPLGANGVAQESEPLSNDEIVEQYNRNAQEGADYLMAGDFDAAIEALTKAYELSFQLDVSNQQQFVDAVGSALARAYRSRGVQTARRHDWEAANADFFHVLELDPKPLAFDYSNLANTYHRLGLELYLEAGATANESDLEAIIAYWEAAIANFDLFFDHAEDPGSKVKPATLAEEQELYEALRDVLPELHEKLAVAQRD